MRSSVLLALATAALAGACAFRTHAIDLVYPPLDPPRPRAVETAFARPRPLLVARFEDRRSEAQRVGEVRNAWDMHTAWVQARGVVADWVRAAVALELEPAGFQPTDDPVAAGTPPLVLHGKVLRCGSAQVEGTRAEVELDVTLKRGFKHVWTRRLRGTARLTPEELAAVRARGADPWAEALARALAEALAPLPAELRAAYERDAAARGETP